MILGDASRILLAGGKFFESNTENIKLVINQMVERYWWLCPLKELIWIRKRVETKLWFTYPFCIPPPAALFPLPVKSWPGIAGSPAL